VRAAVILRAMQLLRHAAAGAGPLALMVALASGSVWGVVIQWSDTPAGWMALPAALLIATAPLQLGLVANVEQTRRRLLAPNAALLVLATLYAQYLGSAGVVSREMGFDFLRTLREIGPELALSLARERAGTLDWVGLVAALAFLVAFAWMPRRRRGR